MIWILYVVAGLVGLIIVMAVIGLALPRDHVACRTAVLAAPPDTVWRAIADVEAQVTWRRGLKRIEPLPDQGGKRCYREHTTQGAITFVVDEERPPSLRIGRIADDKLPFGGRWILELAPEAGGTRLTITEDGFIKNPVFRFLSKTVFPEAGTIKQFLADLGRHLGVEATPAACAPSRLARGAAAG